MASQLLCAILDRHDMDLLMSRMTTVWWLWWQLSWESPDVLTHNMLIIHSLCISVFTLSLGNKSVKTETKNAARFVYGFTVVDVLMNQIVLLLPLIVKCSLYNNLELLCSTLFLDFSDATLQVKIVLNLPKNVILYTLILKIRCKVSALSASFVHKAKPQFIIRTCHLRSVKHVWVKFR